jgi:hypothetical protein
MAGFNYTRAQATADRLIKKFGGTGAIQRQSLSWAETAVPLVVIDYRVDQVDGTRIRSTDKQIFVSMKGQSFEIDENDRVKDPAGNVYSIVPPVKPLDPSSSVLVFVELQGRR